MGNYTEDLIRYINVLEEDYQYCQDRVEKLETGLQIAIDDLYKAANQFKGLMPNGQNWKKFEEKATRAEKAIKGY